MTPERWREVEAVVLAALERAPAARPAFVAARCGGDDELRDEVDSLLRAAPTGSFLERPAVAELGGTPTGARLAGALAGRYAVERELGAGGMATVYLATDLRHRRRVALKVLSPQLSAALGPERFLREIEVTAGLQHPHILPLFDSGSAGGLLFYVMPYVEGESLRARLQRERQLPVSDAVRIATEVADALAHAHGRGVIHRDIKPENILLQGGGQGGHALVADFGIALAVQQAGGQRMTQTGLSIGTPQYMAPEQATGERTLDARVDVYALGAVLYELLVGEPPFTGATPQAVAARALTEAPRSVIGQRPAVPPHVDAAIVTALEKVPADRFASASAFATALGDPTWRAQSAGEPAHPVDATRAPAVSTRTAAVVAAATLGAAALAWAAGRGSARPAAVEARGPVRFVIDVDSGSLGTGGPAISPDGRTVAYAVDAAEGARLYVRRLDDLVPRPLAGTAGGERPFFSPDGRWVAFFSSGTLSKVPLAGGPAVSLARMPSLASFEGGWWSPDDTITFVTTLGRALYRVPAGGGALRRVTVRDTTWSLGSPQVLPGGRHVLVTLTRWAAGHRMGVVELASGRVRELGPGVAPRYAAGHIVFAGPDGELYRQPFDTAARRLTGAAVQVASGLALVMAGVGYDVSPSGALVYRAGGSPTDPGYLKLSVADRAGREVRTLPARLPWSPRLSPDGRRVAYGAVAQGQDAHDLWVTDLEVGTTQRLTTDGNNNNDPQWSPDGRAIAYSAAAGGAKDLLVRTLDGGPARVLARRPGFQFSHDWFRDGHAVLFVDVPDAGPQAGNQDLWVQPAGGGPPRPYITTPAGEIAARASPDGRWVAYTSNETGRNEVYVQSYPRPGRRTTISTRGGQHPVWRADGRELYYWQGEQLIAVELASGGAAGPLSVRGRVSLFRASYPGGVTAMYDASPDGTRFVLAVGHERANRLVVALDALGPAVGGK